MTGPKYWIYKKWSVFGVTIKFSWRGPEGMGRFGACWNWKVGAQWGSSTILFSLLVAELTISRHRETR